MRIVDYAQKQIQITAEENGIQNVTVLNGRLYIEFPSGRNYELSEEEIKNQATDYLRGQLEYIKNS